VGVTERSKSETLTWRGARAFPGEDIQGYDGHTGIDWVLPENTPVFAVTGGRVVTAGARSFECILQDNEVVTQLTVTISFIAPDGDTYSALYTHLNRIDVAVGDIVTEGAAAGVVRRDGLRGEGVSGADAFSGDALRAPDAIAPRCISFTIDLGVARSPAFRAQRSERRD
jgi:peptidase M23-like protein